MYYLALKLVYMTYGVYDLLCDLCYVRKADGLLEMISEDTSELRKHKLAYGTQK